MARFRYEVASIGLGDVHGDNDIETTIQRLLNSRDAEGWEFVESHPSQSDATTRLFVFRRELEAEGPD
jgi:hypothetical protein